MKPISPGNISVRGATPPLPSFRYCPAATKPGVQVIPAGSPLQWPPPSLQWVKEWPPDIRVCLEALDRVPVATPMTGVLIRREQTRGEGT